MYFFSSIDEQFFNFAILFNAVFGGPHSIRNAFLPNALEILRGIVFRYIDFSTIRSNTIDANWTDKIANVSGVDEAYPIYVVLTSVGDDYMNTLIGIDPNGTTLADISMKEDRLFKDNESEAIMGDL